MRKKEENNKNKQIGTQEEKEEGKSSRTKQTKKGKTLIERRKDSEGP